MCVTSCFFACFVVVKMFVFVRAILSFVHGALKLDPFYIICCEHLVNFYIQNNQGYGLVVEILMVFHILQMACFV